MLKGISYICTILILSVIGLCDAKSAIVGIGDLAYELREDKAEVCGPVGKPVFVDIPSEIEYEGKIYPVWLIKDDAFRGEHYLQKVNIPSSIVSIGSGGFAECSRLDSIVIPGSVEFFGGDSATIMHMDGVFFKCSGLTTVEIEEGVTTLGMMMFADATSLSYLTLPSTLQKIGEGAFIYCQKIKEVRIPSLDIWCNLRLDSSPLCKGTRLYINGEEIVYLVVPDGISTLDERAFYGNPTLESAKFPDGLTHISHFCFALCDKLRHIQFPCSLESLGERSFDSCTALERIDCYASNPPEFKENNNYWFDGPHEAMPPKKDIPFKADKTIEDIFSFKGCDMETIELHVPVGSKEAYVAAEGWNYFVRIIDDLDVSGIDTPVLGAGYGFDSEASAACIEEEIYTLHGTRVYGDKEELSKGFYIIKKGSRSRKILIK